MLLAVRLVLEPTDITDMFRRVRGVGISDLHFHNHNCFLSEAYDKVESPFAIDVPMRHPALPLKGHIATNAQILLHGTELEQPENTAGTLRLPHDPLQPVGIRFFPFAVEPAVQAKIDIERLLQRIQFLSSLLEERLKPIRLFSQHGLHGFKHSARGFPADVHGGVRIRTAASEERPLSQYLARSP